MPHALLQLLVSDLAQAALPAAVAPALTLAPAPTPGGLGLGWVGGALVVAALAAATLWMRQRQKTHTRHLRVIETCGLGPKRQVALVLYGKRVLLLASTDAGITLIDSQAATAEMLDADVLAQAGLSEPTDPFEALLNDVSDAPRAAAAAPRGAARRTAAFETQLSDAEETIGLRRKLAELGSHP